ncbi:MAG: hypothetical protein JWQ96_1364 [Segetibacter sp.]|nr:hypothetical protein [Segetibacter sp.]
MKTSYYNFMLLLMATILSIATHAQQTNSISGTVRSSVNSETVAAVSILIKGSPLGTFTDDRGRFRFSSVPKFPVTLIFSSIGFTSKEVIVTNSSTDLSVVLDPSQAIGQEVVVSASRVAERILESPVTVERVSAANIRNTPASNYYDMIGNLKGVDMTTASLLFKTPSTRGFNTSGNLRLNQLVDGMDNQAPGLNFSLGNVVGVTELDVESMELLSGASSALYGAGGMNGTLLINSKNPFKYQGLSYQVKQGVMHVDNYERKASPFFDWTVRWAKKISEKFAFKTGLQFIQAKDWIGIDYSNYSRGNNPITGKVVPGDRTTDPAFNGVNVYGDETLLPFRSVLQQVGAGFIAAGAAPAAAVNGIIGSVATGQAVTRTGYREKDVIDPTTLNVKLSGGLHYKLTEQLEASLTAYWGTGNTVYTGSDRYSLKSLKMGQYKFELRAPRWFARAYTTQENAGESFNASATAGLFNEAIKPSQAWIVQYTTQYLTSRLGGANDNVAHNMARATADAGRPTGYVGNSPLFKQVASTPIPRGGLFLDKSDLYVAEGQYNLTDLLNLNLDNNKTEVLVGGNIKQYVLNSQGTLFADTAGRIKINEVGTYLQVSQKLFNERLRLTASGRYDKNENFKGRFTPRFSAVVEVAKDHNIRLSYQTAYRFPSTQNQWINLTIGGGVQLIGGLPQLREFHNFNTNPVYTPESVAAFGASGNPSLLVKQTFGDYKPESSYSYEAGYKGLIGKKLLIDVYGYYSKYQDFLSRVVGLQSSNGTVAGLATPKIYSIAVNTSTTVDTRGWGASAEYLLPMNFSIGANVFSDVIRNVPAGFIAAFNTPEHRANISLSNSGMLKDKRVGFNLTYRYQDGMYFEGDFGSGDIPGFNTLDGQINYKFPPIKSMLKLGATNILNNYYRTGFGNPGVGGLYYVSFAYNVF